jgi:hypothetical protein
MSHNSKNRLMTKDDLRRLKTERKHLRNLSWQVSDNNCVKSAREVFLNLHQQKIGTHWQKSEHRVESMWVKQDRFSKLLRGCSNHSGAGADGGDLIYTSSHLEKTHNPRTDSLPKVSESCKTWMCFAHKAAMNRGCEKAIMIDHDWGSALENSMF